MLGGENIKRDYLTKRHKALACRVIGHFGVDLGDSVYQSAALSAISLQLKGETV